MASTPAEWPRSWSRPGQAPLNTRPATPSSGAYYKVGFVSTRGNGRRITASQDSAGEAFFLVPFSDRLRFELDTLGYSEYVSGQKYLRRRNPLRHGDPADKTLVMESLESISFHNIDRSYHTALGISDGEYSKGWPATQMSSYRASFRQTAYDLQEDTGVASAAVPELKRNLIRHSETNPYHRKISGWGLMFDSGVGVTPAVKCTTIPTLPEYTTRLIYTSIRWPEEAVPESYIANSLGKVNSAAFDTDKVLKLDNGSTQNGYPAEELMFEDFRKSPPYHGSDGTSTKLYFDLTFLFLWNPRNWNKQLNPNTGEYEYVQFVDSANASFDPVRRLYVSRNFNRLFFPAGAPE